MYFQGSRAARRSAGSSKENISYFLEKCQMLFCKKPICNRIVTFCVPTVKTGKNYRGRRRKTGAKNRPEGRAVCSMSAFDRNRQSICKFPPIQAMCRNEVFFLRRIRIPRKAGRHWCGEQRQGQNVYHQRAVGYGPGGVAQEKEKALAGWRGSKIHLETLSAVAASPVLVKKDQVVHILRYQWKKLSHNRFPPFFYFALYYNIVPRN